MRIFWWRPAAWLRVTGPDSTAFLQGQLSNDLRTADRDRAVYGLWLDHKGRVHGDSFAIQAGPEVWWLGSYFSPAAAIRSRLESYIIADDVAVEDCTADWEAVTLLGGNEMPPPLGTMVRFPGRRSSERSEEWLYPANAKAAVRAALAGRLELSPEQMERERIAAGIPAIPADIGPGDLPNEGGLETVAISYTKGCYLGQEVMARLKSMGQVRRRLRRIRGSGSVPSLPSPLFQGDRKVGELRTAVVTDDGFIGLALLSRLNVRPEASLAISFSAGSQGTVTIAESS